MTAHSTVDGDVVVVVEGDQLAELHGAGQRAGLVRDAFHQAAVTQENIGVVIDDLVTGTVELPGQGSFGQGHAHRVGDTLSQRTRGGFDSRSVTIFRMSGGL